MRRFRRRSWCALLASGCVATAAHAAEHVTLKNGFDMICDHRVADGAKVRLYVNATGDSYIEVNASDIVTDEYVDLPKPVAVEVKPPAPAVVVPEKLTDADLK